MKKIALFISSLQKGGSERVMTNLAAYFAESGYEVLLVTQRKAETEYELSAKVRRVYSEISEEEQSGNRGTQFYRRFAKLRSIWKRERPDVILSFIGKNNCMALLTSQGLHIPVVVSVRGEPKEEYVSKGVHMAAKLLFPKAAAVVMQTKASVFFFPASIQKNVVVLKNPLNATFIRPLPKGEREKIILAVGRLDENKNHRMLIRAFSHLAEQYPEYKLVVYGEGVSRRKLEELVEECELEERVFLPGVVQNVAEKMEQAEIFVLPSYSEGMPNTLMEAMASGMACISTDCPCGGPAELICSGENGILIPVGEEEALTKALESLMQNHALTEKLGKNAALLQQECSPQIVNAAWRDVLERCMR